MSSFRIPLWIPAACGLLSGCVVTPDGKVALKVFYKEPTSASTAKKDEGKEKDSAAATVATTEKSAEKPDNPFRKQDSEAGKAGNAKVETASNKPDASTDKSVEKGTPARSNGVLGIDTLKLIDEELADATPDERADWYEQLKRVDPAVIPQILQARRMSLQIAGMKQQDSDAGMNDSELPSRRDDRPSMNRRGRDGDIQLASRQELEDDAAFPGRNRAQHAVYEADGSATRERGRTSSKMGRGDRGPYVVQQVAGETLPPEGHTGASATQSSNPRQGLARFLPRGATGMSAQLAANSPSAVSLLPPSRDSRSQNGLFGLDQLISETEADLAQLRPGETEDEQTAYIQRHVYLRMLYLMADHPERALTAIPGVESADQEFWQQLMWSMANYFDTQHIPAAKDRAGQSVAQLTTATLRLREQAGLELRNMAFCRQINYYGNFERFPRDEFHPGQEALLYAEIENFKSELTVDGQYRTLLKSTIEIVSPSGEVRWQKDFPATEDLCNNHRRDYFHNYQFSIPERIPLGPHKLKLTVFDELNGKMVSQSINFLVR